MQKKVLMIAVLSWAAIITMGSGCSISNVDDAEGLKAYFDTAQVRGCFALYDNNRGEFTINNKDRYLKRFPPGGTFNLVTALVGLQTGALFNEKTLIGSQTMVDALKADSTGYFRAVAARIGRDTLVRWIDTLSYGNKNTSGPVDSLGFNDSLQVSPDEQMGLVKRMFFHQLAFQQRTQDVVRSAMLRESNAHYALSYVTGTAREADGTPVGWVVGWIEESMHPYFFVLNIDEGMQGEDLSVTGVNLLRKILASQGFFKGVK
jgi:beta-lactamase class D